MPGAMSFFLTTDQVKRRTKTVTRRLGWAKLQAGETLRAVAKVQGLKKGEKQQQLALIRIVDVRREPLDAIDQADCAAEGFPNMTPAEFVGMFCRHMNCDPGTEVVRIEFEYIDSAASAGGLQRPLFSREC